MYTAILAAVNEFTNSRTAARYAAALARACRARLFLVFAVEEGGSAGAFRHGEAALEKLFHEAEEEGVDVESVTVKGAPLTRVRELAEEHRIDVAFIATRREDIQKRFFVRTHARELITHLPCSVAMVRAVHMGKTHTGTILVPLKDTLSHMEERAYFTAKLAQGLGSRLTLFHTPRPLSRLFHGEIPLRTPEREARIPKDVERFLKQIEHYGRAHEKRTGCGGIARSITTEAALKRNDLIIMGASERSLLTSVLRGNPVEEILHETPCNLIIFRPRSAVRHADT
ncbi:MAG: universal stress protein [Thermodesulfovibrionales bacterium]